MNPKEEKKLEKELIVSPLGDDDIKFFLPNAKIMKYNELNNYNTIEELLPKNKSFAIILYENQPNKGHWTTIMRYKDKNRGDIIEFFDSLADNGEPDAPLKWVTKKENKMLGQGHPILTDLLNKTNKPVIYNKLKFQSEGNKKDGNIINTCGRHCLLRLITMLGNNYNLEQYQQFMKEVKEESKNTYDEIVSHLINDFMKPS